MTPNYVSVFIASRVAQLRHEQGFTQASLADECATVSGMPSLNLNAIKNIESQRKSRAMTVDEWLALANVLGVSPLVLLLPPEYGDCRLPWGWLTAMEFYHWLMSGLGARLPYLRSADVDTSGLMALVDKFEEFVKQEKEADNG